MSRKSPPPFRTSQTQAFCLMMSLWRPLLLYQQQQQQQLHVQVKIWKKRCNSYLGQLCHTLRLICALRLHPSSTTVRLQSSYPSSTSNASRKSLVSRYGRMGSKLCRPSWPLLGLIHSVRRYHRQRLILRLLQLPPSRQKKCWCAITNLVIHLITSHSNRRINLWKLRLSLNWNWNLVHKTRRLSWSLRFPNPHPKQSTAPALPQQPNKEKRRI